MMPLSLYLQGKLRGLSAPANARSRAADRGVLLILAIIGAPVIVAVALEGLGVI